MDYKTLDDVQKKNLLYDALRNYESEHFRLSMVNEPGAAMRLVTLESNIAEVKDKLGELGLPEDKITPISPAQQAMIPPSYELTEVRDAGGNLVSGTKKDEEDAKKAEEKPKTTRRRSRAKKTEEDKNE